MSYTIIWVVTQDIIRVFYMGWDTDIRLLLVFIKEFNCIKKFKFALTYITLSYDILSVLYEASRSVIHLVPSKGYLWVVTHLHKQHILFKKQLKLGWPPKKRLI